MFIWNRMKLEKELAHLKYQRCGIQRNLNALRGVQAAGLFKTLLLTLVCPVWDFDNGDYSTRYYAMQIQKNALVILDEKVSLLESQLGK